MALRYPALVLVFLLLPVQADGHGGGLDGQGGHVDRRTGEYHCHREPCFSLHQQQRDAEEEAREEGRPYSRLYDRDDWPHWVDDNGNCLDARAEELARSSLEPVEFHEHNECLVASGKWKDPYTGELHHVARDLDMDHLVPLRHAHGHGGDRWSRDRRRRFANDPDNLVAVSASQNRSKGYRGPDEWLPPNEDYWCEYGRRWSAVKERYELMVTPPEEQALEKMAATCDETP